MKKQTLIIKLLTEGKTQPEISEALKALNIYPNSLSTIEKELKKIRAKHGAKSMFHLGVILSKRWITNDYPQHENTVLVKDKFNGFHLAYCTTRMIVEDDLEIIWQVYGIGVLDTDEVFGWQELPN